MSNNIVPKNLRDSAAVKIKTEKQKNKERRKFNKYQGVKMVKGRCVPE